MKVFVKYYFLVFPLLIIVFGTLLHVVLEYESSPLTIITNISMAFVFSPRKKEVTTQAGTKKYLIWVFSKKNH